MYTSWDRATERPSMPAQTIWCLGPSPRMADYYIFAWKTMSSCPRTGHKYFGRLLQMKQMWNNAYYIIHCRETENAKAVKAHNVQKVLATGVCENPVSVVLEVVPCMYLLNFFSCDCGCFKMVFCYRQGPPQHFAPQGWGGGYQPWQNQQHPNDPSRFYVTISCQSDCCC